MEKWLFWGLIEASTIFLAVAAYFAWRAWKMYKQPKLENDANTSNTGVTDSSNVDSGEPVNAAESIDAFIQYIDQHISVALDKLEAIRATPEKHIPVRNKLKLWGTLLKAQRAMFMNNKQDDPLPILQRFLSTVLDAVTKESKNGARIDSLKADLADISGSIQSQTKGLAQKISSLEHQNILQAEIRSTLSREDKILGSINIKENELKELNRFIKESRKIINELKSYLASSSQEDLVLFADKFNVKESQSDNISHYEDYHSLKELTILSKRQQIVIDQLKSSLQSSKSKNHSKEDKESQTVALKRLMKLTEESNSLVQQLENEINNENLTIEGMKNKLSQKEEKIKLLELKIKDNDSTVSDSLKSNSLQKTATLNTYKTHMSNANHLSDEHIQQQVIEVEQLERLLKESETCVALLTNELNSAEEENIKLIKKVESIQQASTDINSDKNHEESLKRLNDETLMLESEISKLNISILESPAPSNYDAIKSQFDAKKMELSRLEFAHSDLEKKYLKALKNKEASK